MVKHAIVILEIHEKILISTCLKGYFSYLKKLCVPKVVTNTTLGTHIFSRHEKVTLLKRGFVTLGKYFLYYIFIKIQTLGHLYMRQYKLFWYLSHPLYCSVNSVLLLYNRSIAEVNSIHKFRKTKFRAQNCEYFLIYQI